MFQELIRVTPVTWSDRNTDTHSDQDLMAVELVGSADQFNEPRRKYGCISPASLGLHDGEFIAAETRNDVAVANTSVQSFGYRLQKQITDR